MGHGLLLGCDDRLHRAGGQGTPLVRQGHDLTAVRTISRAKLHQPLFHHGGNGRVQRLLGLPPLCRHTVLGLRLMRSAQRIQHPECCVRQAVPLRHRVVQGVALIELAVRYFKQIIYLPLFLLHRAPLFKIRFRIFIIIRNRIYVKPTNFNAVFCTPLPLCVRFSAFIIGV